MVLSHIAAVAEIAQLKRGRAIEGGIPLVKVVAVVVGGLGQAADSRLAHQRQPDAIGREHAAEVSLSLLLAPRLKTQEILVQRQRLGQAEQETAEQVARQDAE